jgi:hypothetical protein
MAMNKTSIDIFAETNPAFCSLILFNFCKGYYNVTKTGAPFPLLFLPMPIVLSNDLSKSFAGTNVNTGFFRWVENNPELLLDLTIRINDSSEFLKPAIEFGVFKRIFKIDDSGNLIPVEKSVKKQKNPELDRLFKFSERLGNWIGQVNSTKTIYNQLGLQL